MVGAERINFANLTCSDRSKLLSQTPSKIFLNYCRRIKLVTGKSGSMVK